MAKKVFYNIDNDIEITKIFSRKCSGYCLSNNIKTSLNIYCFRGGYSFEIEGVVDSNRTEYEIYLDDFKADYLLKGLITSNSRSFSKGKKPSFISKGTVLKIENNNFDKKKSYYRSVYSCTKNIVHTYFESYPYETSQSVSIGLFSFIIENFTFNIFCSEDEYLIVDCDEKIDFELFDDIVYRVLITIGFITGKFLQDEVFTFQYSDIKKESKSEFIYHRLRKSSSSIFQGILVNPFSYKFLIGEAMAKDIYEKELAKKFNSTSFVSLVNFLKDNSVVYALLLFNEATDSKQSLLVSNNCLFIVLEVLKKTFYHLNKHKIQKNYTEQKNTLKYVLAFEQVIELDNGDLKVLNNRNKFLHGDVKDLADIEMQDLMYKQITLIYKLILSHTSKNLLIINHSALRSGDLEKSFVKI